MASSPRAGQPAELSDLVDLSRLVADYYTGRPDPSEPSQRVAFGTSGHRGSALANSFNEAHIAAIVQATVEWRAQAGITGPLFVGKDTHALSEPAWRTTLEVLAAHDVEVLTGAPDAYTPTPAVSRAIVAFNRAHPERRADGLIITPSHNPPTDGGIKYNPPHGGPAEGEITSVIEARANALLGEDIGRVPYARALARATVFDFLTPYVEGLGRVVDLQRVRDAKVKLGVHPLGGSSAQYWVPIAERYGLDLEVVDPQVDGTFRFMPLDHDGKIRMDCSSPYAMNTLVGLRDNFDVAFGNDADADRHGIVTPAAGLLNPNHFLSLAVDYLLAERTDWPSTTEIGKTVVTTALLDRVAAAHGRRAASTPVGFKWFVEGLSTGRFGFAGEESAGATLLDRKGGTWTTDKDGIVLDLLAAEIAARRGRDLAELYDALTAQHGRPFYRRVDAPASPAQKKLLKGLDPERVKATELAGHPITARRTRAPEGDAPIGGLQVVTDAGWFAARPSGTEDIYKIYAESFVDEAHLERLLDEAKALVQGAFDDAGV
jgi:phosphoglucomutase